jgi:hypothetical protein
VGRRRDCRVLLEISAESTLVAIPVGAITIVDSNEEIEDGDDELNEIKDEIEEEFVLWVSLVGECKTYRHLEELACKDEEFDEVDGVHEFGVGHNDVSRTMLNEGEVP